MESVSCDDAVSGGVRLEHRATGEHGAGERLVFPFLVYSHSNTEILRHLLEESIRWKPCGWRNVLGTGILVKWKTTPTVRSRQRDEGRDERLALV